MAPRPSFHSDARTRFDELGNELRALVVTLPLTTCPPASFTPDLHVPTVIPTKHFDRMIYREPHGGRFLRAGHSLVGVRADGFSRVTALAERIQRTTGVNDLLSIEFVVSCVFDWLVAESPKQTITDHVIETGGAAIRPWQVWVPIADLYPETEIDLGRSRLRVFSRALFDSAVSRAEDPSAEQGSILVAYFEKRRTTLQGLGAVTVDMIAERERAAEIATEIADTAVSVLRFFSPVNQHPDAVSHWAPLGLEPKRTTRVFFMEEGRFAGESAVLLDTKRVSILDAAAIQQIRSRGLDRVVDVLRNPSPSAFERDVLRAIVLYSRGALMSDVTQRLIHQLAALEGLLIKDGGESIQQNVGERMAFFATADPGARSRIIQSFKDVYDPRSRFVHHGLPASESAVIRRFAHNSWVFLMHVTQYMCRFSTRDEFLKGIEDIKLGKSAPPPFSQFEGPQGVGTTA